MRRTTWWKNQKTSQEGIGVYLITAPAHAYELPFARACAEDLLQVTNLEAHPDFTFLNPLDEDGKLIDIDDFREQLRALQTPAVKSSTRVVIITSVDSLSAQGQNALLKSIEEPRVSTVYFLLARAAANVLETVRSRAIAFELQFLPHTAWNEKQQEFFNKQSDVTKQFLEGRPALVDQMMNGKRESAKIEKTIEEINDLLNGSFGERLAHVRVLAKKYDHKSLRVWLQEALLLAHRMNSSSTTKVAIAKAIQMTARNLNKTFILDQIIFNDYET